MFNAQMPNSLMFNKLETLLKQKYNTYLILHSSIITITSLKLRIFAFNVSEGELSNFFFSTQSCIIINAKRKWCLKPLTP